MLLHVRRHAVAYLALFLVLGGTSFAATKLGKGSVTNSKLGRGSVSNSKLQRGSVTNSKLAANSVTGGKVKNGALTSSDFAKGTLLRGATGPKGNKGEPGPSTGPAGGDLQGTYPNPTIKPLGDWTTLPLGSCRIITMSAAWAGGTDPNGGAVPTQIPAFRIDRDGVVHLRGGVSCPQVPNVSVVSVLPTGARPLRTEHFAIMSTVIGGTPLGGVYAFVSPDGSIGVAGYPGVTKLFFSLDGISFDSKH